VPSLHDIAQSRADLSGEDLDWLHLLLADWQLLADLSFADLLLWLPVSERGGFVVGAQMRPTTGPTAYHDDVVGTMVARGRRPQLDAAFDQGRICRERDPDWPGDVPVREETIPVVRAGRVVAVVSRHTNLAAARTPSRLELTYLRTADDLAVMVSQGRFPVPGAVHRVSLAPRVGDGLIRLDADGVVTFASPNALSAYRRLGLAADLSGTRLGDVTADLVERAAPVDEPLAVVVGGTLRREAEIEAAGTTVRLRVIPLDPDGVRTAALVLCRDVTEVRHRERELVGKDATIREIHHRVKNNLQTVAALLRLQGRRLGAEDETARAALHEAERRIGSIALVHETLARTAESGVDFDEVADRVAGMMGELGARGEVRVRREGSFGLLGPEVATPLALVLVELVQNAVEHGLAQRDHGGGTVQVLVRRDGQRLRVEVVDDGGGLAPGFDIARDAGLGLQIVRTLVEGELGGVLTLGPAGPDGPAGMDGPGGARVVVDVPRAGDAPETTKPPP
jgi:two-component sensor histidine kinase